MFRDQASANAGSVTDVARLSEPALSEIAPRLILLSQLEVARSDRPIPASGGSARSHAQQ